MPLHKWLHAFYLMLSARKGVSAHQIHRTLGVSYKTAWFMGHRMREALRSGILAPPTGGSPQKIVAADETLIGRTDGELKARAQSQGCHHKMAVLALIDRQSGARLRPRDRQSRLEAGRAAGCVPRQFSEVWPLEQDRF